MKFTPKGKVTRQLVFSPDSTLLLAVNDRDVYRLNPKKACEIGPSFNHPKTVNAVSFSPDGQQLLTACQDQKVRLWDVASGEITKTYEWDYGTMTALSFAPDGDSAVAGDAKGRLVFWDID
ncbi:MAG: WD40 repeat domain-containing protein [Fimbriiglobus sp.]